MRPCRSLPSLLVGDGLSLLATTSPVYAGSAIDWYIELKKLAKYARILAQGGARGDALRSFADAASGLARMVLDRETRMPTASAEAVCMGAVRYLEAGLKRQSSYQAYDVITAGEDRRHRCLSEIQRR